MGPIDKDKLLARLRETFLGELEGHLVEFDASLLELEKSAANASVAAPLARLMRTAHSLKGAARSVDALVVESICHRLETAFLAAQEGNVLPPPETLATIAAAVAAISDAARRMRAGENPTRSNYPALFDALKSLEGVSPKPGSVPLPAAERIEAPTQRALERPAAPPTTPQIPESAPTPLLERARSASVRVAAERLDALVTESAELMEALSRLRRPAESLIALQDEILRPAAAAIPPQGLARRLEELRLSLERDTRPLAAAAARVNGAVHAMRLMPFAKACAGLERVVLEIGRTCGKQVALSCEAETLELDRALIEALADPLRHLVRNAVDHGIELPAERVRNGKTAQGLVRITAAVRGETVIIAVSDDGAGLDLSAIRAQLERRGLPVPEAEGELARTIFRGGFSTAPRVTDVSGRGVGLEVVQRDVEALRGSVDLRSEAGKGTTFLLSLPFTLTTIQALLANAGGLHVALESQQVERCFRARSADLGTLNGRAVLPGTDGPIPLVSLAGALGRTVPEPQPGSTLTGVVARDGVQRIAFVLEELLSQQNLVVKPLDERIGNISSLSGASILPGGEVAVVVNLRSLIRDAAGEAASAVRLPAFSQRPQARKRILVADDSVTTRSLEVSILEAAGYEVIAAPDGASAWRLLQERGADLVVSDVEMPGMDGFAFCSAIRNSKRFARVPVILLTGLERDVDKARGIEAGADAYLVKRAFDQRNLLSTIEQLI